MYSLFLVSILLVVCVSPAFADTEKYPVIMVIPSETCQKAIQYHLKSDCPPLSALVKYDTSNQMISGHFVLKNGEVIRQPPQIRNHWMWYTTQTICVDCLADLSKTDLYKEIIIEPHGFTWIDKVESVNNNSTWHSYSDVNMAGCNTATIAYSDALLSQVINYMKSNCTKNPINNTSSHKVPIPVIDYWNASQIVYQRGLAFEKANVTTKDCRYVDCSSISVTGKKW